MEDLSMGGTVCSINTITQLQFSSIVLGNIPTGARMQTHVRCQLKNAITCHSPDARFALRLFPHA